MGPPQNRGPMNLPELGIWKFLKPLLHGTSIINDSMTCRFLPNSSYSTQFLLYRTSCKVLQSNRLSQLPCDHYENCRPKMFPIYFIKHLWPTVLIMITMLQ